MATLFALLCVFALVFASSASTLRSLSSSDVQRLLVQWDLDEHFGHAFAEQKIDGRHLEVLEMSDYSATSFPRTSKLQFKVLLNEIKLLKKEQVFKRQLKAADATKKKDPKAAGASKDAKAADAKKDPKADAKKDPKAAAAVKDYKEYAGVRIKQDKAWVTFGKAADIKLARTGAGQLSIDAKKITTGASLSVGGQDIGQGMTNIKSVTAKHSKTVADLSAAIVDNTKGRNFDDALAELIDSRIFKLIPGLKHKSFADLIGSAVKPVKPGTYKTFVFKVLEDGTEKHICIDNFRFVKRDGSFAVPASISNKQSGKDYGAAKLKKVFNVGGSALNSIKDHWCAWGKTTITVTMKADTEIAFYKFTPHSNACTNDPQHWQIWAKRGSDALKLVAEEKRKCPIQYLFGYNHYSFKWAPVTAKPYKKKVWRIKVTRDGTHGHVCFDAFRFVMPDGKYGVPIAITNKQKKNDYGVPAIKKVFNVGGSPTNNGKGHWCAWGMTEITVTFSKAVTFSSYKFIPHASPCTNDPQTWNIQASNSASASASFDTVAHENRNCPLKHLKNWNVFQLPKAAKGYYFDQPIIITRKFKFWRWVTTKDGTGNHICFDKFRFVGPKKYGVPIKTSNFQAKNDYGIAKLRVVMNQGGSPTNEKSGHWCAWGKTTITVEFKEPMEFTSYKFVPHASACSNDPQGWDIMVSNDGKKFTRIQHIDHKCPLKYLKGYNEWKLPSKW